LYLAIGVELSAPHERGLAGLQPWRKSMATKSTVNHKTATPGTDNGTRLANGMPVGSGRSLIPGSETLLTTLAEGQREWLEFVAVRLEKDGQRIRDTLACKRWQEVMAVNTRWAGEMMHDYQTEATKILTNYTKHGADAVQNPTR
jgi:hypothetical protein